MKTAWIGDQAAFEAFQRYRHSHPSASVTSVFEKVLLFSTHETVTHRDNATPQLLDALRYVIMDPRIESVFGFEVSVHNADGEFRYRDYAITLTEQQFSLAFPTVFLREKAPERDELRNYAASCFINGEDVDVRGLAYHFPHNKLTYVYWGRKGKLLSNTRIVKDKNIEEFMQDAAEEFGREWKGTLAFRTQPVPEYGIPVQRWTKVDEPLPQHFKINVKGE